MSRKGRSLPLLSQLMPVFMRFVAVCTHFQTPVSFGFDTLSDAVDFLFWVYEEHGLIPQGVYDTLTGQTTLSAHNDHLAGAYSTNSISHIATDYLTSMSQWNGFQNARMLFI